jgi:hypothetical protein
VQLNPSGKALTGRHFDLTSSDTNVAHVGGVLDSTRAQLLPKGMNQPSTCPDTTIDPAAIVWGVKPPLGIRSS